VPSILIQLDEPLLRSLNKVAPAAKRQRAEFIRRAVKEAIRKREYEAIYPVLNKFIAAEISATIRHIPIEVPLGPAEGMAKPCVVNCDNLPTISKAHLVKKISRIPSRRVHEV